MRNMVITLLLLGTVAAAAVPAGVDSTSAAITLSETTPKNAGAPVLHSFVSFSIEFAFFPDFAGNSSHPNLFSNQLLENLAELQGAKPYIRVGGNTQDFALYDPDLKTATNGTVIPSITTDYPVILSIGSSFFESYSTWPSTKFIHGFNLGMNGSTGMQSLLATVPLACKALDGDKLAYLELGNEPDLLKTSAQGIRRPANWTERDYVDEWLTKTKAIKSKMAETCPDLGQRKYIAPSFAGVTNSLDPVSTWRDGLNTDDNIALNSEHNYVGGAAEPGVSLQKTPMNHTMTVQSVAQHLIHTNDTAMGTKAPYYGNAMVAAMLHGGDDVRIVNIPLTQDTEAAYAAYVNGSLSRIAVFNMQEFNYTELSPMDRPQRKYTFQLPSKATLSVQRLMANGSNAVSGITWDGWSYNYELEGGKPVRLSNVTIGETLSANKNGIVEIEVPDSSGAILNLEG